MTRYTLGDYEDKLIHQIIHLDQGVWYCPEYRANKAVRNYPSRTLQLAWSVFKGYIEPSEYIADILFESILSRQGERWQCFGEDPEDLTDCVILCRQMMLEKGFGKKYADALLSLLSKNRGHVIGIAEENMKKWRDAIPSDPASRDFLIVDDATAAFVSCCAPHTGDYLARSGNVFYPLSEPTFVGFEFFATGMIDEGREHAKKLLEELSRKNIKTVTVLSGQAEYMLRVYLPKIGLSHGFEVKNILGGCERLDIKLPSYVYAGSFNLRYLNKGDGISRITANERETPQKNAPEFSPLVDGDKRVNVVSIWEKPLCAEYENVLADPSVSDRIFDDAFDGISVSKCKSVLSFEPYSYKKLKDRAKDTDVRYYLDAL
jgi:hypothetical protein